MFLVSNNNESFYCDTNIAIALSETLKMMGSFDEEANLTKEEQEMQRNISIPLPYESKLIEKVIEYCNYFATNPYRKLNKPLKSRDFHLNIDDQWYVAYIDRILNENRNEDGKVGEQNDVLLRYLLDFANYLQIDSLVELLCAKFGSMCYGKSIEDINKFLARE